MAQAAATMESLSDGTSSSDGGAPGREERNREMRKEREKSGLLF